jgi:hypothetical protein
MRLANELRPRGSFCGNTAAVRGCGCPGVVGARGGGSVAESGHSIMAYFDKETRGSSSILTRMYESSSFEHDTSCAVMVIEQNVF